eukprot:1209767-Prymnesium_polylepis.1
MACGAVGRAAKFAGLQRARHARQEQGWYARGEKVLCPAECGARGTTAFQASAELTSRRDPGW